MRSPLAQRRMKPIINLEELELSEFGNSKAFEAQLARIGHRIGARQLGAMLHIVPPGKKAFPKHAHHANEEMIIILKGNGTYHMGSQSWPIREGDVVAAPAGDGETAHQIENTSTTPLRYLCISTQHDPDVVEYPGSGQFAVASMVPPGQGVFNARLAFIGRKEDSLDYFDGEE